jgi:hypothetical protein
MERMVPTIDSPQGDHSDESPAKNAIENMGAANLDQAVTGRVKADNSPPVRQATLNSTKRFLGVGVTISYVPIIIHPRHR